MSKKYLFTCLSIGLVIVIFSIFQISGANFEQSSGLGFCGTLGQEAEEGQLMGQMQIGTDGDASGGHFVYAPDKVKHIFTIANNPDKAVYCVHVPESGIYQVKAWVNARNLAHNSFFITVDDTPSAGYLWDLEITNGFQADMVNDRTMGDPLSFNLEAGEHNLTFYNRESGTHLDRFELVKVSTDTPNPPEYSCGPLEQEAEDGELFGGMTIGQAGEASGGKYVFSHTGINNLGTEFDADHRIEYCMTVDEPGDYKIVGRALAQNDISDSFFVQVNDQPAAGFLWDVSMKSRFVDDDVNDRGKSDPAIVSLPAGDHIIKIFHRENETKLDKIRLEMVSSGGSPVDPTPTTVASTPTSMPPTPTQVFEPACGGMIQEAEVAELFGQMVVSQSSEASGGAFVSVPLEGAVSNYEINLGDRADFCVTIPENGNYKIIGRAQGENQYEDSFYFNMDDVPAAGYLWDVRQSDKFINDDLNDRGKSDPQILNLSKGEHTLSVYLRETGTKLDRIEFVAVDGQSVEPTPIEPTPIEPTPVEPTGTPMQPTSTPVEAYPSPTQPAPPPTSTSVPATPTEVPLTATAIPAPGCGGLEQEAEAAQISGSMTIGFDGNTSGGRFVFTPSSYSNEFTLDDKNKIEFCVSIVEAGNYRIDTLAKAPNGESNSMFVQVDGGLAGGHLWDIRESGSFIADSVNDRGKSDPTTFSLSKGEHQIAFYLRESGAALDKIKLVSESGGGAPIDPTPTSAPPNPTATPISGNGNVYYVSRIGSNGDGRSWGSAWNELSNINWNALNGGDIVYIDGGSTSMTYRTTLKPTKSGHDGNPILVQLSGENGRNGRAVFFGGNNVPLPECGQRSWDESQLTHAGANGIKLEKGVSNITIDGRKRGGFTIHGWKEDGVRFDMDRINNGQDDNTQNITLRYMEIYNNGGIRRESDGSSGSLYFPNHASSGIELSGIGHVFQFMEIHDNGGDAIQSGYTNPGGGVFNNMDDFTLTDSWLYNQRVHSGRDNSPSGESCSLNNKGGCDELGAPNMALDYHYYPSNPPNRQESFNWCTHSDGIQIFSSNDFNTMTIERSIIGPNFMTAMLLGDRASSNATAWVNNLKMRDVVITRFMHNALGMKNPPSNAGRNWDIENVTIYGHFSNTNKGSLHLASTENYTEHRIADTIMVHGRTKFPNGNVSFSNNCDFGLYSGSLNGQTVDPKFRRILDRDVFENNLNIDFATVFRDDYTPNEGRCSSAGSGVVSVDKLLSRFNKD